MWKLLMQRFHWLDPAHPIAVREAKRNRKPLPTFIRKLTDPWTMLGYAAMLHGIFFVISLLSYSRLNKAFPNMMLPFLTPFGTPVAAAILHSILYWAMLIGICNYVTYHIASDIEAGYWRLLLMTPYTTSEILLAKMMSIGRIWARVLRILVITRVLALILIPISAMVQRSTDNYTDIGLDLVGGLLFIAQPLVDAFLAACLSVLAAFVTRGLVWNKLGAYGLMSIVSGAFSGIGSLYLIFKSPLGTVAGLFAPLGHWAPLASALTPPTSSAELFSRTVVLLLVYLVLPIAAGVGAFALSLHFARSSY